MVVPSRQMPSRPRSLPSANVRPVPPTILTFAVDDGAFLHELRRQPRRRSRHVNLRFVLGYGDAAHGYDESAALFLHKIHDLLADFVVREDVVERRLRFPSHYDQAALVHGGLSRSRSGAREPIPFELIDT